MNIYTIEVKTDMGIDIYHIRAKNKAEASKIASAYGKVINIWLRDSYN